MKADRYRVYQLALDQLQRRNQLQATTSFTHEAKSRIQTVEGEEYVNFTSDDYFGLAGNKQVIESAQQYVKKYGAGSGSTRLGTGTLLCHHELEQVLADWLGKETALVFDSELELYTMLLPLITDKRSVIFADRNINDNLLQGCLSSEGSVERYRHNDLKHLEIQLKKSSTANNRLFILAESVFRMDGDITPVDELAEIAGRYNAMLIIDEAHSIGVFGDKGQGLITRPDDVDLILGSFSNVLGGFGSFVACNKIMRDYLVNYSFGFKYSASLPPGIVGGVIKAVELVQGMESERKKLQELSDLLRHSLSKIDQENLTNPSDTGGPIVPLFPGDQSTTLDFAEKLKSEGYFVKPFFPLEGKEERSRINFSVNIQHRKKDIEEVASTISKLVDETSE